MTQCVTFGIRHTKAQVRTHTSSLSRYDLTGPFRKTLMAFGSVTTAKAAPRSDHTTIGCEFLLTALRGS